MLENKTQFIAYIGQKLVKKDTVGGTATIWNGFGDIQEVPHGAAVKLIQHPDVWITAQKFQQQFVNALDDSDVVGAGFSAVGLSDIKNINNSKNRKNDATVDAAHTPFESSGESGQDQTYDKISAIQNAIFSLEVGNKEHFSETTGAPLLTAVRIAANNESITVKDLNAVWKALSNKSN